MVNTENTGNSEKFMSSMRLPMVFLAVLWVIHIAQFVTQTELGFLGVYPRQVFGIKGILFSPLIHADFSHLTSNSFPLFLLGSIIMFFYQRVALRSIVMIYFLTGLAVWLLGRSVFHIGASGVVYGMVAFIFWNGIFRRNVKSIVLALIVMVLFHGMFLGILPNQEGISWESHLFGAIVGIFTAFFFKEELEADEVAEDPWAHEPEFADKPYFFDRDVFEKTKKERQNQRNPSEDYSDWTSTNTWED